MMNGYWPVLSDSHTSTATPCADISGFKSYVATFGDATSLRSSSGNCVSEPPLKKNVTCAYFSVSNEFDGK